MEIEFLTTLGDLFSRDNFLTCMIIMRERVDDGFSRQFLVLFMVDHELLLWYNLHHGGAVSIVYLDVQES